MTDQELKELFEEEARRMSADARVPAPGSVWWRAAMRARADAADTAVRPLFWFQAIAAAAVVGALAAGVVRVWPVLTRTVGSTVAEAIGPWAGPLITIAVITAVAAPVALYLALRERRAD